MGLRFMTNAGSRASHTFQRSLERHLETPILPGPTPLPSGLNIQSPEREAISCPAPLEPGPGPEVQGEWASRATSRA